MSRKIQVHEYCIKSTAVHVHISSGIVVSLHTYLDSMCVLVIYAWSFTHMVHDMYMYMCMSESQYCGVALTCPYKLYLPKID